MDNSRTRKPFNASILAILALTMLGAPMNAEAVLEAKMYAWTSNSTACSASLAASSTSWLQKDCEGWYEEMNDQGWSKAGKVVDGSLSPDWFCDHDVDGSSCTDGRRIDGADAAMVCTHGCSSVGGNCSTNGGGNHWMGLGRSISAISGTCLMNDPANRHHLGDWDLEYMHVQSCHSANDSHLPNLYTEFFDPNDTLDPSASNYGRRLHIYTGYHGNSIGGWFYRNETKNFAKDAQDVSISDAWFDNVYHSWVYYTSSGNSGSVCPVAYAVDESSSACSNRLADEGYGSRKSDPSAHTWYCADYIRDCDPAGEDAFDPPS